MKPIHHTLLLLMLLLSFAISAQEVDDAVNLNQAGAMKLALNANLEAGRMNKRISITVLDSSGVTILLLKGDQVGPHNTEAFRRKAYSAVSTKTPSFDLMNAAASSKDAQNLNSMPELLLLGGGAPIFKNGELIGSLCISGGGGSENDHNIALKAIEKSGFKSNK